MRTVLLMAIGAVCWAESTFGTWGMDAARSTFAGDRQPKSFTVRIEPHSKGEVFTIDRIEADSRATSSRSILYFDGAPRDFQDFECSGTQSSQRVDNHAVEIMRKCQNGAWIRLVCRPGGQSQELILDIKEQRSDGHRFERRLVFRKQAVSDFATKPQ